MVGSVELVYLTTVKRFKWAEVIMSNSKCKLCGNEGKLEKSHIIPKSYFKSLKSGNGQLVAIVCDDETQPKRSNIDPKEELLCRECEQFISVNYERYGTQLFKRTTNIKKAKSYIEFNGFKYTEYYLYLISILWRASISTIAEFSNVKLNAQFDELLAHCIKRKSIKLGTSLKLDHFIRISVLRVIDSSGQLDDNIIKKLMMSFGIERGETAQDGMIYYFMIDGFLIGFYLNVEKDIHDVRTLRIAGQLKNRKQIRIPKVEIVNLKQVHQALNTVIDKAKGSTL
ncbi:hypothetical protein IX91_06870 [Vibrio tubiashii ATCC 19109]|uniref:HNH endonuclease n=1 Tax=Vibrio tubiashii ATCC 19109 TaxID=1051646 RepID=F9T0W3_9VIBR|nr:hypothetical protein IX91_06870 [Vibrio tubiashii ATCC 19109]EGU58537.1 hypothetical protein VITU9109_08459 [Vibrio tubiashii ATCC 19109]EIF03054.1 hypothetical protein VT1337_15694 [Vibrio tubiashii NCIMB 1337 = ATCC 19106]